METAICHILKKQRQDIRLWLKSVELLLENGGAADRQGDIITALKCTNLEV